MDGRSFVVAHSMTESKVDDASVVPDLLSQVSDTIERFTADGAYDKIAVYEALREGSEGHCSTDEQCAGVKN